MFVCAFVMWQRCFELQDGYTADSDLYGQAAAASHRIYPDVTRKQLVCI